MILMDVYCEECQNFVRIDDDDMARCACPGGGYNVPVERLENPFWSMNENDWKIRSWSNAEIVVQKEGV